MTKNYDGYEYTTYYVDLPDGAYPYVDYSKTYADDNTAGNDWYTWPIQITTNPKMPKPKINFNELNEILKKAKKEENPKEEKKSKKKKKKISQFDLIEKEKEEDQW